MALPTSTTNDSSPWDYIQPLAGPVANVIGSQLAGSTVASGNNAARAGVQNAAAASSAALSPYSTGGTSAENALLGLYGIGGQAPNYAAFEGQPGYQFMKSQGTQAINRGAAAAGGGFSSSTLGALDSYNSGLANTTYSQYLNNLYGLTTLGAGAASNLGRNAIDASKISGGFQVGSAEARGAADSRTGVAAGQAAAALAKLFGSNTSSPNTTGVAGPYSSDTNPDGSYNGGTFNGGAPYYDPNTGGYPGAPDPSASCVWTAPTDNSTPLPFYSYDPTDGN
jgi:hypothetical protein